MYICNAYICIYIVRKYTYRIHICTYIMYIIQENITITIHIIEKDSEY